MSRLSWVDYVTPACQAVFAAGIAGYAAFIAFHAASVWLVVAAVACVVGAAVLLTTMAAMRRSATEEADVREEIHEENDEEMAKESTVGAAPVRVPQQEQRLHAVH